MRQQYRDQDCVVKRFPVTSRGVGREDGRSPRLSLSQSLSSLPPCFLGLTLSGTALCQLKALFFKNCHCKCPEGQEVLFNSFLLLERLTK